MARTRKMLTNWDVPCIQSFMKLIETQSKETLTHWSIDYSEAVLIPLWSHYYPKDTRPENALQASRDWLAGTIKFPQVKKEILGCHKAARDAEENPAAQGAARAIGQAASTIHSVRHCMGVVFYGALAVAYNALGTDAPWNQLEHRAGEECQRMLKELEKISF